MMQSTKKTHLTYRPDIDGLRAVAVISVLGFHFFPENFESGFIGVDIFFVISGYLISSIIYKTLEEKGGFSFANFYQGRIIRILPALLLVLLFSCIFGWFFLLRDEYRQLGKHVAAASLFSSNLVLWREVNYFDNAAETKPLLHLWSLAIEEQFYLIWPPILILLFKFKNRMLQSIILLTASSFLFCIWQLNTDQISAFYNPAARFWEILCGALLAWFLLGRPIYQPRALANLASATGLMLLIIGFLIIRKEYFPGWHAILPTVGAVLLIYAGNEAWFNKFILSNKLAVWIGLISYPLYLWHWPLIVFLRIIEGQALSVASRLGLIVASIFFAAITYLYIENYFKKRRNSRTAAILLFSLLLIGFLGGVIFYKDGVPLRKYSHLHGLKGDVGHTDFHEYVSKNYHPCMNLEVAKRADKWEGFVRCSQSKPGRNIDTVLLGDSHAEHLFIGFADALKTKNVAFYTRGAMPFLSVPDAEYLIQAVASDKNISTVLISAYWIGRIQLLAPEINFQNELDATVTYLENHNKKVALIIDSPSFPFEPKSCQGHRFLYRTDTTCSMSLSAYHKQTLVYKSKFNQLTIKHPNLVLLEVEDAFCGEHWCRMADDEYSWYRDSHHLNIPGSKMLGLNLVEKYHLYFE